MKMLHSGEGHYDPGEELRYLENCSHPSFGQSNLQTIAKQKIKDEEVKKSLIAHEEGHQAEHAHTPRHE